MARIDNLEFLSDVIPQVVAAKQPRETKAAKSKKKQSTAATEAGQPTLGALFKLQTATAAALQPDQELDSASDSSASRKGKGKSVQPAKGRDCDEERAKAKDI